MSTIIENIDLILDPTVLRASVGTAILGVALCVYLGAKPSGPSQWQIGQLSVRNYVLPLVIPACLGFIWVTVVNRFVPIPYMDEIFHIPQAQVYCQGKHTQWDDKITTPPGLYYLSIIWARLSGFNDCSVETLRLFNVFVIACTAAVAAACRAALEGPRSGEQPNSVYSIHTGINIALFPVLFFFSGLYYTDVISTFIVLVAYLDHLGRLRQDKGQRSLFKDLYTVLLGILALFMRQTNVFWVVVYMGGVEAVQALRELPVVNNKPARDTWLKQGKFFVWKSSNGAVHDPPLQDAWPDDLVSCLLSIGIAAIFNIGPILRQVYPRLIVAGLFAGFVVWNGGVVLGDKSNHVATLHLAQMLYIWPLFAFFSAPIFLPQALRLLQSIKGYVALKPTNEVSEATMKTQQPHPASKPLNYTGILLSVFVLGGSVIITGLIVHYNTIIHPFTLADNRHYMFYVFRYTVMRGPVVRVLLAPAYVFCAILVWTTLYQLKPDVPPVAANSEVSPTDSGAATSQVIILLATITLSLMTAPLVEPRYFILPWLFWRLLVPQRTGSRRDSWDWTLFLETTWFLLVNGILMYIFITRPFVWKMQDGTVLDGGNVQRFMW